MGHRGTDVDALIRWAVPVLLLTWFDRPLGIPSWARNRSVQGSIKVVANKYLARGAVCIVDGRSRVCKLPYRPRLQSILAVVGGSKKDEFGL